MNWTRLRILNDLEFWAHQLKSPTASAIIRRVILIDSGRPEAVSHRSDPIFSQAVFENLRLLAGCRPIPHRYGNVV